MGSGTDASASGERAAVVMAASMKSSTPSGSSTAAGERHGSQGSSNAWNDFQHQYSGRHWGSDKFRAEYWKFKAAGKRPT